MGATAEADIARQQRIDRLHGGRQGVLLARMGAVVGAQDALARREVGARPALRQSLIDLAAVATVLADDLEGGGT